jgi:hypothetical protein
MTKEKEKLRETFCKLFALLGSSNENEADTARKKIHELAIKHKMTWNDVIELVGFSTKDAASADADGEAESAFDAFMNQMPPNQFAALIGISHEASLFRSPDGVTWADISVKGHRETWPVYSAGFKGWLRFRYFGLYGTSPSPEAIDRCLDHVEAKALFGEGVPTRDVYLRVAGLDDKIYLDLCNDDWTAVEVDGSGWRIVKEPPVRFSRNSGMKELPTPVNGGTLSDLHGLLSVDDDGLVIVVSWLLGALRGKPPYPVLCLAGPAGSSKSTAVCFLRDLIDPGKIEPGALPQEVRDLAIASAKRFVVGYDNLSGIPVPISDMLCRLSTGGGFAVRRLYSDDGEVTFSHTRPIVLAGIEDVVGKHDLTRRTLHITLEVIPGQSRKLLSALRADFRRNQPRILGCLLDIVSTGLKNLPHTKTGKLPSLADFAQWMAACETAVWPAGTFARVHAENEQTLAAASLEADVVAAAVLEFLGTCGRAGWQGTAKALLAELDARASDRQKHSKNWPKTPHAMAGRVRRAIGILLTQGWRVERGFLGHEHARVITFAPEAAETSSASSASSARSNINDLDADDAADDAARPSSAPSPAPNLLSGNGFGHADDADDVPATSWGDEPVCRRCGLPSSVHFGQLIRAGQDGSKGHYHPRCWTEERTKGPWKPKPRARRPALGPESDSLDELK